MHIYIWISTVLFSSLVWQTTSSSHETKRLLLDLPEADVSIASVKQDINQLKHMVTTLGRTGGGATFTRWGRTMCPNETDLVYSGFTGGSHYTHSGGAANYLCLPSNPTDGRKPSTSSNNLLYGAEFETNDFGPHSQNQYVPCAVCRSSTATSSVMIPARNECYPGWTVAYSGNLAAGYYGHAAASEYVCVDGSPEYVKHGESNQNGKLFYPVTSHCGSLACPPYQENKELGCVVCLI